MRNREQVAVRAAEVDAAVVKAFEAARPNATLAAVGGYGRCELFPHSDVDLLLLVDEPPQSGAKEAISELLKTLWDGGLRVSQSVHTVEECCEIHEGNLELTISLLDQRLLCGEAMRFEALRTRFPKFLAAQRAVLIRHLCQMTHGRHEKYGKTIYHLEPNVKEHPGALRDMHVLDWLAKLRGTAPEGFEGERDFIFGVRIFLHRHFGRDNNVLSFDAQEAISDDPEAWMRRYYSNAREIFRAVRGSMETAEAAQSGLLSSFRDWRSRISNSEFTVSRDRILLREPGKLYADGKSVLRLMEFAARHQVPLAPEAENRVREAMKRGAPVSADWKSLRPLLALPRCALAIRAMQETGVLQRIIPEWERIDCLVVRDFSHRYTVDEHTTVAIGVLEELQQRPEGLRARMAELLSEIDHPEVLRLALLLHDIGKGGGTGEHVAASSAIAHAVMDRLGVPADVHEQVIFLIEHHLDLSSTMTSRDLEDAETRRALADAAGTMERLKLLTLLTYADISAVNPNSMTPWRLEQLWRCYLAGYEELTKELDTERAAGFGPGSELSEFVAGFPIRYLRTHDEAEIRNHSALAKSAKNGQARVDLRRSNGTYELVLVAGDRPNLLASTSGVLAGFGMNILKAEAFNNARKQALQKFNFADPHRTLELNPPECDRLRDTVMRAANGQFDVSRFLKGRRTPAHPRSGRIPASVAFNSAVSETATLIEIVAEDRPGLLYDLTRTLSAAGCNIEVILIDTEAHRALDVFYVTAEGKKLGPEMEAALKEQLLKACAGS